MKIDLAWEIKNKAKDGNLRDFSRFWVKKKIKHC
jgi:hypothetical protein